MTLPQALAGRALNLATFWGLLKARYSASAPLVATLNGGKVYSAMDDFSRDERGDSQPWGRLVIIPAETLWPPQDTEPDKSGFGWQTRRPCRMRTSEARVQRSGGSCRQSNVSTTSGSSAWTRPMRLATRSTCRSTGRPGTPSACPSTTLAVLRPTPGSSTSASIDAGTSPP